MRAARGAGKSEGACKKMLTQGLPNADGNFFLFLLNNGASGSRMEKSV
jgi:hypothetical protein